MLEHELQHDATVGMDSPQNAEFGANAGETTATSNDLKTRLSLAKEELTKAIGQADLQRMTALRKVIKALPEQIIIASIHELKNRLKQIEIERVQNQDRIKEIMTVRREVNLLYVEKVNALIPYKQKVDEYETKLQFARENEILLLQDRRSVNTQLFNLSESLQNDE